MNAGAGDRLWPSETGKNTARRGAGASLARPGGNVTGLSVQTTDLSGKRLELLREVLPGMRRLGVMSKANAPTAAHELSEVEASARALGLKLVAQEVRGADDIAAAIRALETRADALHVVSDPLLFVYRAEINRLALAAKLPTIHNFRDHVEAGGLMSYGTNFAQMFRRAAEMTDKILRGAKPGDIPVEQPTRASDQSQDRQGARPRRALATSAARRRGD